MAGGKEYKIQFVGLAAGKHEYDYKVTDKFFEDLDYSELKNGNIRVDLSLLKQSTMMSLDFRISGTVKVACDLCTEDFDLPISGEYQLIVKVGGSDSSVDDDDIITVAANEHELDLSQYIYEYIILSLPIKRVHPDNEHGESSCDPEMIEKMQKYLTDNPGADDEGGDEKTDPRWDGLKGIKLN
ncbi:MAG TPA: DUF177 domain-containing protein [Bacteroidia bacterium]|jgi:uncharacterized metal-binding protein YceD (DUF177 family)